MRIALAVLMALHGIAHGVGFAGSWGLLKDRPPTTTVLAGRVDLGAAGARVYGIAWLFVAASFLVAAFGAVTGRPWWLTTALVASLASLLLSVLSWPDSRIGVYVNLAILAAILVGSRAGWLN